jgi:VWFA-related protein
LVEVDIVALKNGKPVVDLNRDDFEVFDEGKRQKIALFGVKPARDSIAPTSLPRGAVSNRLDTDGQEPAEATIVLFDRLNTAPEDQANAGVALLRYLRSPAASGRIAIYEVNKTLRVVQDFTTDKDRLIRAANRAGAQKSVDEGAAELVADLPMTGDALTDAMTQNAAAEMTDNAMRNRADITAFTLELIAKHLAGLAGRKKLVWITAAFPAIYTYTGHRNLTTQIETREFSRQIDHAAQILNDGNVAVYPIDPRPLTTGGLGAPGIDTMNLFAGKTGGIAQYALGDIEVAIKSAMQQSQVNYSLGFYPSTKLDGNFHSLKVKAARSGVELQYRKGYLASEVKPPTDKQRQISLNDAFANPLEQTGLGLTALARPADPGRPGLYSLDLHLNAAELHFEREQNRWVALLAVATQFPPKKHPNGTLENIKLTLPEDRLKSALRDGYVIRRPYEAGDLKGDLRVVVQDRITGLAGSVRVPIGVN